MTTLQRRRLLFGTRPFSPSDIAGLAAWYDASYITGLVDGDPVTTWADRSGLGRDVTQATAGKKPLYKTAIVNGKPVVRFDGTDDLLARAPFLTGNTGSVFLVAQFTDFVNNPVLWSHSDTATDDHYVVGYITAAASQMRVQQSDSVAPADIVDGNDALPTATAVILEWHTTGAAWSLVRNSDPQSLSIVLGANTGDWFADVTGADNFTLGALVRTAAALFLKGDLAEVIVYDAVTLTASDKSRLESYLSAKYGIALV